MTTAVDFLYGNDPAGNDADEVRLLLGDTDSTAPLLTNGELAYLIARVQSIYGPTNRTVVPPETSSNIMAAAYGADLISRKFAAVVPVSADGVNVDLSSITKSYTAMAVQLRAEYERQQATDGEPIDSSIMLSQLDEDYGIRPLTFGIGMFDNPEAGRQDYGDGGWYNEYIGAYSPAAAAGSSPGSPPPAVPSSGTSSAQYQSILDDLEAIKESLMAYNPAAADVTKISGAVVTVVSSATSAALTPGRATEVTGSAAQTFTVVTPTVNGTIYNVKVAESYTGAGVTMPTGMQQAGTLTAGQDYTWQWDGAAFNIQ